MLTIHWVALKLMQTALPLSVDCIAGEAMASVHGANRLAGAGLLEAALFGYEAGQNAAQAATHIPAPQVAPQTIRTLNKPEPELVHELSELMWQHCSLIRDAVGLQTALTRLDSMYDQTVSKQLKAKIQLCQAIVQSALLRTESRGAHYRVDYPTSDATAKHTISKLADGKVITEYKL